MTLPALTEALTPRKFLTREVERQGLAPRDEEILAAIVLCESSWQQFWPDGSVKISNGNIGLAQINYGAHHAEYETLGMDPEEPFDNLSYAVILYKREGITPWAAWSGPCFLPKIGY